MMPGSRSRRAAGRAAVAVVVATLGGCHTGGLARVAAVPNRPASTLGTMGRAALLPATVALDEPSETAAIDPSNSARGTVTPASAIGAAPKADLIATDLPGPRAASDPLPPTPLLDAALVRARSRGEVPDPLAVAIAAPAAPPAIAPPAEPIAPSPEVAPPALSSPPVVATPEPRPAEVPAPAPAPAASPEEAWRDGVRKLVGLARSRQEQGGGPGDPWGLRARVLAWLAEPDIDPDLGQRDADTVRAVLRALQAAAGAPDPRPDGDAHHRGDDVRLAVQTLEARAPLELVDLQLCSKVERFGDYVPFDPPARRAGDWVVIYCEVDGLHQESTPDGYQTRLAGQCEIVPEGGGPAITSRLDVAKETFPRRRRDYYMAYLKQLPADLAPGAYTVRITLKDVFTDRSASRAIPLAITRGDKGPAAPPPP